MLSACCQTAPSQKASSIGFLFGVVVVIVIFDFFFFFTEKAKLINLNLQVKDLVARIYGRWQDLIQNSRLTQVT